jgi:hypothetical protein
MFYTEVTEKIKTQVSCSVTFFPENPAICEIIIIIIIIIIFINCKWVDTRWQWLFYMYTKYDIDYY